MSPHEDGIRQPWLPAAILAGGLYVAIGIISPALGGAAGSNQALLFWRWSAFVASGGVFAAHIALEHFRRHSPARLNAWHVAVGVAFGGLGLALMANLHDVGSAAGYRPRMLIALVAWPLLTAVPAFVVALVVALGLGMKRRNPAEGD